MFKKVLGTIFWASLVCAACIGQTSFQGLTAGTSTRSDAVRALGQPVRTISATLFEYNPPAGIAKVQVAYAAASSVVERIEVYFLKPISRAALIRKFNLPQRADASRMNAEGKLVEFFGGQSMLAFIYQASDPGSGVTRMAYYSRELFESASRPSPSNPADLSGKSPYDKERLLSVVRLKALPTQEIIQAIQQRGVDFRTTPGVETEFREAGAAPEVIEAMRTNYRPPLTSSKSPGLSGSPVLLTEEQHHHLTFENQYARVFELVVPPGDATLFHVHSNDAATVSIGDGRTRVEEIGRQPTESVRKDGEVRFSKAPITHRVVNIASTPYRLIIVEILGSPGRVAASTPETAPRLSTVLDNERVHVTRVVLEPGESTNMHTHGLSGLSVFLTTAKVLIESPGRNPQTLDYKPGRSVWRDAPLTHLIKNIGSTRFEAVAIDWK